MPYQGQLWACEDLIQTQLTDGYKFVVKTDVPCHLWLRWTTTPPRRHSKPIYKRGIYLRGDIRFCFVTFTDNEQEEEGDTLIHTFYKHDWPICQTRYFYFHGTIQSEKSLSVTALFKKHFQRLGYLLVFEEPWTLPIPPTPPPELELLFTEPWTIVEPWVRLHLEEWTS